MQIAHILVTSDLSAHALRPAAGVAALARALGARVTLLHVAEDLPLTPRLVPSDPEALTPERRARLEEARAELERQRTAFGGLEVTAEVVAGDDVATTVVEWAAAHAADLIAISSHGRSGLRHLVLGSVAQEVVRRSRVPVLVFPQAEGESGGR